MTATHTTNDDENGQCPRDRQQLTPANASDAEQQKLWRRYLEQQARRACPGCGEAGDAVL